MNQHNEIKKIKVAAFVGIFPNITESWFIEQTTALIDAGVDIDLFSFKKGTRYHVSDKVKKYNLITKTTFLNYFDNFFLKLFWSLIYAFKIIIFKPKILNNIVNYNKFNRANSLLKYICWVGPLVNKLDQYQVIHCHQGMIANKFLVIRDLLELKQKFVTTFYGQDSSKYIQQKGLGIYDQLKNDCSYFLVMTTEMKERFIKMLFPPEKILVHYTGVNIKNYSYHYQPYELGQKFRIICVGSFVEKKGITDLIKAISEVIKQGYQNIELNLVGGPVDPVYAQAIHQLITDLQLENYVILKGLLPHQTTLDLFKNMHLMVQLSKIASSGDTDDLPFVLLEAQLSGLPVITTDSVGITDGVINNQTGFVVNEGNYHQVADKIIYLINQSALLNNFSQGAHNFVKEKFDINKLNKSLIQLYQSLIY